MTHLTYFEVKQKGKYRKIIVFPHINFTCGFLLGGKAVRWAGGGKHLVQAVSQEPLV